jgi:hypothetical protein
METLFGSPRDFELSQRRRSWRFWLFVASPFLVVGILVVLATRATTSVQQAQLEAKQFHYRVEKGWYEEIHAIASPAFQRSIQPPALRQYLSTISAKMGACKEPGKPTAYFVNANQSGTIVRLRYRLECSNGPLDEDITFIVDQGVYRLLGYRASSPSLLKERVSGK